MKRVPTDLPADIPDNISETFDVTTETDMGSVRRVGFEIEYAGVPLWRAARVVQELFGGDIDERTKAEWYVVDTSFGTFRLEIDAEPVKKLVSGMDYKSGKNADGFERLLEKTAAAASEVVASVGEKVAPLEIIAPPIPIDQIEELDKLREGLFYENAQDTQASLHHAFGLHINPEAASLDAVSILHHIQAFSLLYPLLKERHRVNISRRLTPFIEPYGDDYIAHIFTDGYAPTLDELVGDYHRFNKSRNKALDMLPMFAELDGPLVRGLYGAEEKINARPTYHYRLPNCEVSRSDWSLMEEWRRWLMVEWLAADQGRLAQMRDAWKRDPGEFAVWMRAQASTDSDTALAEGGG